MVQRNSSQQRDLTVLGAVQAPFLQKTGRPHREDRLQVGEELLFSRDTAGEAAFAYGKAFYSSQLVLITVDPLGQQFFASHFSNSVMHAWEKDIAQKSFSNWPICFRQKDQKTFKHGVWHRQDIYLHGGGVGLFVVVVLVWWFSFCLGFFVWCFFFFTFTFKL